MHDWPIYDKEALVLGNLNSSVGLCTLWTEKEQVLKNISKNDFCVCGNLYTIEGINNMIRNIFAKTTIRNIVLFGADLSRSGEALLNLKRLGIDKNHRIIGTNFPLQREIDRESIEVFRKNVNVIDARNNDVKQLKETLKKLNGKKMPPFSDTKIFKEAKHEVSYIPSEKVGFVVRGKTIAKTWLEILDLVMKFGLVKKSEYPVKQKELLNIMAVIDEKDPELVEWLPFTDEDLKSYLPTILTAEKPATVSYTYGERLFRREDRLRKNQVEKAIEHLKKVPYTRRAIAFTWRVAEDTTKKQDQPCLTQINWSIQNSELYQTVHFRSHDIFGAWPMNMFALKELQEKVAKEVGVKTGPLTCISHSAHIYENKWKSAKDVLEKFRKSKYYPLRFDERGAFRIRLENGEIVVEHFTSDGKKTQYSFRGTNVVKLYREIIQTNLISRLDHAAEIGAELQKAAIALKLGKKYEQDKELRL
jgi:thymidylate synthase (methanogen type)